MKLKNYICIIIAMLASIQSNVAQDNNGYAHNNIATASSFGHFQPDAPVASKNPDWDIRVISEGRGLWSDSSYYDLLRIDSTGFLIAGKFGIFQKINIYGDIQSIQNPLAGKDIFRLIRLNEELVMACADAGELLFYNIRTGICKSSKIPGLEGYCIYNACMTADNTILICGGKSPIAHCKKVVPNGFIMSSSDGGNTWVRKYHSTMHMVWSMAYDAASKQVMALVYRPNRTELITASSADLRFKRKQIIGKGIYHELQLNDRGEWIVTGGNLKNKGWIKSQTSPMIQLNTGMVWSRSRNKNRELYTSCHGQMICYSDGRTQIIHAPLSKPFNLYECGFFDGKHAIAVGSAQTILMVSFKD